MRYNRRNPGDRYSGDFMPPRYEEGPRMQPLPPVSQLDAKEERLLELSQYVGQLEGQNDLLNEDNRRLEEDNRTLSDKNKELYERNRKLESEADQATAGHRAVSEIMDELESELTSRKEKKVSK